MEVRHCDKDCGILPFVPEGDDCAILDLKQKRKEGHWLIEKDGVEIMPECEDKVVRVTKKKRRMLS
jgi:hypothetical protein